MTAIAVAKTMSPLTLIHQYLAECCQWVRVKILTIRQLARIGLGTCFVASAAKTATSTSMASRSIVPTHDFEQSRRSSNVDAGLDDRTVDDGQFGPWKLYAEPAGQ